MDSDGDPGAEEGMPRAARAAVVISTAITAKGREIDRKGGGKEPTTSSEVKEEDNPTDAAKRPGAAMSSKGSLFLFAETVKQGNQGFPFCLPSAGIDFVTPSTPFSVVDNEAR